MYQTKGFPSVQGRPWELLLNQWMAHLLPARFPPSFHLNPSARLNSVQEADDPALQQSLLQLVQQLAAVNPTQRPAESDRINGRYYWSGTVQH